MDDTLLFLHVLAAFALVSGVVVFSAVALGAQVGPGAMTLGERLTQVGGTLVLVFGVWIAIKEDVYEITDGWILGAIVLWFVATGTGVAAGNAVPDGPDEPIGSRAKTLHWIAAVSTVAILVLMVWKPGA